MEFSAQFADLQERVAQARVVAESAAAESREKLQQRMDEVHGNLDEAAEAIRLDASEASAAGRSAWAQLTADLGARRDEAKAKMEQRGREMDAKVAARDAEWAESNAVAALEFASWTVDTATAAVIDAIDAEARADELAKLAASP